MIAFVGIVTSLALGVGAGILRIVNAEPGERGVELVGNVAFAMVYTAPALLAVMGIRRGPSLFVAAGTLHLALAFVSIFSIGLLFLLPAAMFFIAAYQRRGTGTSVARSGATVLVAVVGGVLALFALFARDDPICWATDADSGEIVRLDASTFVRGSTISIGSLELPPGVSQAGCSSDTVTSSEGAAAAAIVAVTLGVAWTLSKRPPGERAPAAVLGSPAH
jgi:hypothetical protein